MQHSIMEYLLDYGSLGIMAGIFLWLYLQNKKELLATREKSFEEQEKIRSRWRQVIEKLDGEKSEMIEERVNNLLTIKNAITELKALIVQQNNHIIEAENELREIRTEIRLRFRE